MNAFLQLRDEEEEHFVTHYREEVRERVEARLRSVNFISDVLEHFFPRLSDTMTVLMGGDAPTPEEDGYLTVRESDFRDRPASPGETRPDDGDVVR